MNQYPHKWLSASAFDLRQFKQCFDENGSGKSLDHLQWQYIDGPTTLPPLAALGLASESDPDGELAGIYAVFRSHFLCNGITVPACQSLDTLTSQGFRGRGLFNNLAKIVYDRCREEGVGFVYGFPNGNSAHGFFNKLKWINLDPVPFLIKPLNLSYFVKKLPLPYVVKSRIPIVRLGVKSKNIPSGFEIRRNIEYGSDYDGLWRDFCRDLVLALDRSPDYMNWRLRRKPEGNYKNIACYDSNGVLTAICIYTIAEKHGGRIGYVMDLMNLPAAKNHATLCLRLALSEINAKGADAVLAWNFENSPNSRSYREAGFFSMPEIIRPIELHFGVGVFDSSLKDVVSKRENWYISYLDSDTV